MYYFYMYRDVLCFVYVYVCMCFALYIYMSVCDRREKYERKSVGERDSRQRYINQGESNRELG